MVKPRYTEAQYRYARDEANALDYARQRGYELVKDGAQYRMKQHDSMVFTADGRWFWNSRSLRGRAIEFAMCFEGKSLPEAVLSICGNIESPGSMPIKNDKVKVVEKRPFVLPPKAAGNKRLFAYLCATRQLDREIVAELIRSGEIYESVQEYKKADGTIATVHNAVFVGRDRNGVPKSAFQRGLSSLPGCAPYKRDVAGSDASAPFCIRGYDDVTTVAVFEASIDAISHATLEKLAGRDYRGLDRIALGGTEKTVGLISYLETHPHIETILLCYDEDAGGNAAVERTSRMLSGRPYHIKRLSPANGKDWNEALCLSIENNGRVML